MSSGSRYAGRHYASGSAKRKAQAAKEKKNQDVVSKTRKLSEFFNIQSDGAESEEIEAKNTEMASHCEDEGIAIEESSLSTSQTDVECTASPPNLAISSSSQREVKSTAHASDVATSSTSQNQNESKMYSHDIGEWPRNFNQDYWIAKGSSEVQHINSDFLSSEKTYDKERKPRFCQKSFFTYKHKPTNKTHVRDWLCYSETKGQLFCFVCKVTDAGCTSRFTTEGFDDWKNANNLLKRHEESTAHRQAIISLLVRKNNDARVDSQLVSQIETEQKYWRTLLERITSVIQFLAERGLAFRGSNETIGSPYNGNYLGLLELIAKFDIFLAQHINTYANKGKGRTYIILIKNNMRGIYPSNGIKHTGSYYLRN